MPQPPNLLTEWAALLMRSFADAGVRDIVISPGSRSTPFVVAAVREERLRCHTIIDERAAAFFALGQARVSGSPSVVLCTSGTAGAHYLPAIVEAAMAFVPLLVLTADRPGELADCAAPQTTDQVKLFGGHVRQFFDLGTPEDSDLSLRALRRMAVQGALAAVHPTPGGVQLNARARKPLEPVEPLSGASEEFALRARAIGARSMTTSSPSRAVPDPRALREVAEACRHARRGVIVCGPAPFSQVADRAAIHALARATGFPIAPEATSQLRFAPTPSDVVVLDALDSLLRCPRFRERCTPDLVLQIGRPPTSTGWEQLLNAQMIPRIIVARHGWNDPQSSASALLFADVGESAQGIANLLTQEAPAPHASEWTRDVVAANALARREIEAELAGAGLTEGAIARAVVQSAPKGSLLMLGNSLTVRLVDTYCSSDEGDLGVLSQRGASGIDGLVAGAAGAASYANCPVTLVLGDVSLLHDLTSLALAVRSSVPLVVVVIQNYGGRIFEQLPLSSAAGIEDEILDRTLTPHAIGFEHAAAMFGVRYARVEGEAASNAAGAQPAHDEALRNALATAYACSGCTLIEVIVPPHGAAIQQRRLFATIDASLARLHGSAA